MTERRLLRATGRNSAIYGEAVSVLNCEVALLLGGQLALKLLVLASYVTCLIIDLVNGGSFNVKDMFMSILFITSLGLIGVGSYYVSKAQQW